MSKEEFACEKCGRTFSSERGLNVHKSRMHKEDGEDDWALQATKLRDKLQEMKEKKAQGRKKGAEKKDKDPENKKGGKRNEAEIGKLKVVKVSDGSTELYFKIGNVELPVKNNFRIGFGEEGMFLEATKEPVKEEDFF